MTFIDKKFPYVKKLTIDGLSVGRHREMIQISLKIPITEIKSSLKNQKLSFSGYFLSCFAKALSLHPEVHAIHSLTGRLISFSSIDLGIPIEVEYEKELIPLIHIVRDAHTKTVKEISEEIRSIKSNPLQSEVIQKAKFLKLFLILPSFIRRLCLQILSRSPKLMKKEAGIGIVSSIGMISSCTYVSGPPTIYNVALLIGGIQDGYLHMNLNANHRILDGAPFARFANTFEQMIKNNILQE